MLNALYAEDNTNKGIQNIPYFHCGPQHVLCMSCIHKENTLKTTIGWESYQRKCHQCKCHQRKCQQCKRALSTDINVSPTT